MRMVARRRLSLLFAANGRKTGLGQEKPPMLLRMPRMVGGFLILALALSLAPGQAKATLIGLTISAKLGTHHHFAKRVPFASPITISPGTTITGGFVAPFTGTPWTVTVTFEADDFTIGLSSPGAANWVGSGPYLPITTVTLSGFPGSIPGFTLTSYTCGPYVDICDDPVPGPSIFGPTYSDGTFIASFGPIRDGEVYTFSVDTIPESASWLLMIVGFTGVLAARCYIKATDSTLQLHRPQPQE